MKTNKCFAILSTSILCVSLLTFGTYSIYDYTSKNKISLKSESMDIKTTLSDSKTFSSDIEQPNNQFANGGSWDIKDGVLSINNMNKYDSFSFNINVKNNKNFPCIFKIYDKILENYDFFKNFNVDYANNWIKIDGNEELVIPFKISCDTNIVKNTSSKVNFSIKSCQFTNNLENLDLEKVGFNNNVLTKNIGGLIDDIELNTTNNAFSVNVPKSKLTENSEVSLKINNSTSTSFEVNENSNCLYYDIELNGIKDSEELLTSSLYIGRNLSNVKLHELIDGNDTLNNSVKYDKNTGYLTFESKNLSNICVEVLKEEYFTPISTDAKQNAIDLLDKINDSNDVTIKINDGDGDFDFTDIENSLDINNKNISIVGLDGSNLITKFNLNDPLVISGDSNVSIDSITAYTDQSILKAMDNSIVNLNDVNFMANQKDLTIIESVKTESGEPSINIYDGSYKAFEKSTTKSLNPLLNTNNSINNELNGNIYIYGGSFENFNPAEVYYTSNNEVIYKSFLAEGTYCRNNDDKLFEVNKLIKNANILNNAYKELYDIKVENRSELAIKFKYNLWLSPYLAKNNEQNMYCFDAIPVTGANNYVNSNVYFFETYTFNFALNEKMLNITKNQETNYCMFKENIRFFYTGIYGSIETQKPLMKPCIYSFDGNTKLFNGYGFDVYSTEETMFPVMYLQTGIYGDKNTFKLNGTSVICAFSIKDEAGLYKPNQILSKDFFNYHFADPVYQNGIIRTEVEWDSNYVYVQQDPNAI